MAANKTSFKKGKDPRRGKGGKRLGAGRPTNEQRAFLERAVRLLSQVPQNERATVLEALGDSHRNSQNNQRLINGSQEPRKRGNIRPNSHKALTKTNGKLTDHASESPSRPYMNKKTVNAHRRKYICQQWPRLRIGKAVKFSDGVFETEDPEIQALIESRPEYGALILPAPDNGKHIHRGAD